MTSKTSSTALIAPMTEQDKARRDAIGQRCDKLISQGVCPTCRNFKTGNVFPGQDTLIYFQDDNLVCLLEMFPRASGHTIILSKEHYADIADMPVELGCHIMRVTNALVNALKHVLGAEKVYLVTMCSGELNHLHFQLLPRLQGEQIGGRVFAAERGVLTDYEDTRRALAEEVQKLLQQSKI